MANVEPIYMDYNATTPVRREVGEFMEQVARECYGNPSSVHSPGRSSKTHIDSARRKVAESLGADPSEIRFTSGGSESDNLAIKGIAATREPGHIITSCIEHPAVSKTCDYLETRGFAVTRLPVDAGGFVDPRPLREAIRDDTFLITIMWANNEAGQIQPIEEIATVAEDHGVVFHTDAVQAFGKIPIDVKNTPVDMLAISGHKFYAPKGVGALYVRDGVDLTPLVHGAVQEMGLRAGTENVTGIAALGEACRLATDGLDMEAKRLAALRDDLEKGILEMIPETKVAGARSPRLPNTTNIAFTRVEAGELIRRLDAVGIAVSGASACVSGKGEPSAVLMDGLGLSREEAMGALRLSLGHDSSEAHVTRLLDLLPAIVEDLRTVS